MYTRLNNHKINKTESHIPKIIPKRRYSKISESTTNPSEPIQKQRKLKDNKDENCSDIETVDENVVNKTLDFDKFIKHFAEPSAMYKYLSGHSKSNPFMLNRNLISNKTNQSSNKKDEIKTIADNLSIIRLHDEHITLMKSKTPIIKAHNTPKKFVLNFEQFRDSQIQKDWKTIQANIIVDIVSFYRDNRNNKEGFVSNRVIDNKKLSCNEYRESNAEGYNIDYSEVMKSISKYRVYKSMLHFKILAREKKLFSKNISSDNKMSDELYPVTYEAMIPLHSNKDDKNLHKETYYINGGKYEIFPKVTNMEQCDESMFAGQLKDAYNSSDEKSIDINSRWIKVDDVQSHDSVRKNTKLIFKISTKESPDAQSKVMKNNNKSPLAIYKLPTSKNGVSDFCLSSVTVNNQVKIDVNIAFKFVVDGKIVQWTKTSNLSCPWCLLNFKVGSDLFTAMTKMLHHLNYLHPRFTFKCKTLSDRTLFMNTLPKKFITIEVNVTKSSQSDADPGLMYSGKRPSRRCPESKILYRKNQPEVPNMYRENHKRDYCHTWSSGKIKYKEFDIDSEGEENSSWLFDHYSRRVEEFSDLNHVEKRVIQLWNESLLRYGISIADAHMKDFVHLFIREIINNREKLREVKEVRNTMVLHLMNLVDYGWLPISEMLLCIKNLDNAIDTLPHNDNLKSF